MSRADNQRRLFLELVEQLRPHWRRHTAQPRILSDWLSRHRAGSRDRRLYRELAYTLWRILPWVEDASPELLVSRVAQFAESNRATADFIAAHAPSAPAPPPPATSLLPPWWPEEAPDANTAAEINCLLRRAPLWIRGQGASAAEISAAFPDAVSSPHLPHAWQLPPDSPVIGSPLYRQGRIEIQDAGSQALLHAVPELPPGPWLDACAGAGGKTLQLAQLLPPPHSRIVAHDIRSAALHELRQRCQRAGLPHVSTTRSVDGTFTGVLVDAPCSGSGTWRRAPHLKWTTTPRDLAASAERQTVLLAQFATHVAAGGLLLYATCSLCRRENDAVADAFLDAHAHFRPAPLRDPVSGADLPAGRLTLLPSRLDSDGFFLAAFRRS